MREMGIQAVYPGPNLSKRNLQHRIYPYLLKGVNINYPNHVWSIDITYIRLQRSWMYLAAVIDWYSRYVISWELDQSLEIGFILDAVQRAFSIAKPVIFNSDQGSHFTSPTFSSSKLSFVYFSIATLCTDFANMTISSLVKSLDAIINSTLPSVHVNE
jgi:putative transposase